MALNPAFAEQSGRQLPIDYGYTLLSGDAVLSTVTIDGVAYNLNILGEGEMDGKEVPVMYMPPIANTRSGLGTGNGSTALCRALKTTMGLFSQLTSGSRFHPGRWGVKGGSTAFASIGGGDQFADTWFANFPDVTPAQTLSGMSYDLTLGPGPMTITSGSGDDTMVFSPTPAPIGVYRGVRCRIFDDAGNVVGYGFTTNPAWHIVDAILRYYLKPQQPPLAGLTNAEKACFDWASVVAYAARCAVILTNGAPRFAGNYVFASDSTLTDMLETMLRCSRGYIISVGGKISLMGDDGRASTFLFSGNHLVPGSLNIDQKNVAKAANVFIPKFRDLNIPAVTPLVSIEDYETMGLNGSSPFIPRGQNTVKMVTDGINPFSIGMVVTLGGSTDTAGGSSWDGCYVVGYPFGNGSGPTDIAVSEDGVSILAPGINGNRPINAGIAGGATGGYLGVENARFAERAPTNVRHRSHQLATGGPAAPGLTSRRNVVPVEYDMGNMTFDQAMRLMTYEMIRDLGPDTYDPAFPAVFTYNAPFTGSIKGFLDSIDANGNKLMDQVPGSIITLDDWASPEFAGEYEIQERTITGPTAQQPGTIELQLQTATDASAYTDIVVDADSTFFTVPNAALDMSDRMPSSRPYYAISCTPVWDGAGNITSYDCAIWWRGDTAPTIYPFAVSGCLPLTTYILWLIDSDGAGTAITYGATAGTDLSVLPDGAIPLAVYTTGAAGGTLYYPTAYDDGDGQPSQTITPTTDPYAPWSLDASRYATVTGHTVANGTPEPGIYTMTGFADAVPSLGQLFLDFEVPTPLSVGGLGTVQLSFDNGTTWTTVYSVAAALSRLTQSFALPTGTNASQVQVRIKSTQGVSSGEWITFYIHRCWIQ